MSSDGKTIEEKMNQLPPHSRAAVQRFLDSLLEKNVTDANFFADLEVASQTAFEGSEQSEFSGREKRSARDRVQRLLDLAASLLKETETLARDKTLTEESDRVNLSEGIDFYEEALRFETDLIRRALDQTGGNQARAARLLLDAATRTTRAEGGDAAHCEARQAQRTISEKYIYHRDDLQTNRPRKPARKLRQSWAGALSEYREKYSSLELQKKALDWRGD